MRDEHRTDHTGAIVQRIRVDAKVPYCRRLAGAQGDGGCHEHAQFWRSRRHEPWQRRTRGCGGGALRLPLLVYELDVELQPAAQCVEPAPGARTYRGVEPRRVRVRASDELAVSMKTSVENGVRRTSGRVQLVGQRFGGSVDLKMTWRRHNYRVSAQTEFMKTP